jgi:26S proteasome regulatory subunit N7
MDKEPAITAYNVAYEKTVPVGTKIDILFGIIRIGFFYNDNDVISKHLEKVKR